MGRISPKFLIRCCVCFLGIVTIALGVALTTKADLGTTPISALPYVASMQWRPSIGFFTGLFNVVLVGVQVLVLGRRFPKVQYLQIPVSCVFAVFIDVWMLFLPEFSTQPYLIKFAALCLGTFALGLGVYLEVNANVVMMAGEGAVKMLTIVTRKEFGPLKTCFDVTLVTLGAVLSILLFSEVKGIGEGTVVSAIFVGICVKLLHSLRRRLPPLSPSRPCQPNE